MRFPIGRRTGPPCAYGPPLASRGMLIVAARARDLTSSTNHATAGRRRRRVPCRWRRGPSAACRVRTSCQAGSPRAPCAAGRRRHARPEGIDRLRLSAERRERPARRHCSFQARSRSGYVGLVAQAVVGGGQGLAGLASQQMEVGLDLAQGRSPRPEHTAVEGRRDVCRAAVARSRCRRGRRR